MRFDKLSIATWVLSLATDPARATATVGDFAEESSSHSLAWFWHQIAATTLAQVRDDLAAAPARLVASACLGLIISPLALAPPIVALVVVSKQSGINAMFLITPIAMLLDFQIGRWLAWFTGRPLASWAAYTIVGLLFFSVITNYGFAWNLAPCSLVGAVYQRRRSLRIA